MKITRFLAGVLTAAALTLGLNVPTAEAASTCNGASCVGVNPSDTDCVNDAKTIAAMNVDGNGMLEMRWSDKCDAGWARFTTYRRGEIFATLTGGQGITHAYVSTWTDQGTQDNAGWIMVPLSGTSWWSKMVDFNRPEVCIGTRLYYGEDAHDLGWFWGPCVK